ncbi:MAG: hypothetical protein AAGC46_12330 [Solirubrobacteraceae bacterium]|nr:hypothetical protein [Patulibacter sp.]
MWNSLFNRSGSDRAHAVPENPNAQTLVNKPFGERMLLKLDEIRWTARGAGSRLPVGALPQLGRIEDVLQPLLEHLVANPPNVDEEIAVQALVTDYLPTTLGAYIGLNRQFALAVGADGRTPGDELLDQLVTLANAAEDLGRAVYAHDGDQLKTQGRFLTTKFQQSDLAL